MSSNSAHFTQVIRRNSTYQYELRSFIRYLNYDVINILPFRGDSNKVATYVRLSTTINILTGKDIFKWNIEKEAQKLRVRNKQIIDSATDIIWRSRITRPQKQRFESLSNGANIINRNMRQVVEDTHNSISNISVTQQTDTPLFDYFYNGTVEFSEKNKVDCLVLPVGFSKEF
jgi:hypothetical protein